MLTVSFTTINFLIFLLICFLIYYICPVRHRWIVLLIGSMVFYASFGWEKLIFLLVTSIVVWVSGLLMNRLYEKADQEIATQELSGKEKMQFLNTYKKKCKRCFLIPAIVLVVGALCYCKFGARLFQFLYDNTFSWRLTDIIIPLGSIVLYVFICRIFVRYLLEKTEAYTELFSVFALHVLFSADGAGTDCKVWQAVPADPGGTSL